VTERVDIQIAARFAAVPNAITLLALATGMSSFIYAGQGEIAKAIACVFIAAVLDSFDGRVARALGCPSHFGAELDSLSDVICFGAAPCFILYHWGMAEHGAPGWIACLSVAVAAALRLARFNVGLTAPAKPAASTLFFTGVPAPAGAFLSMLPIYLANAGAMTDEAAHTLAFFGAPMVAALMVSRLPTYSGKTMGRIAQARWLLPALLATAAALYGVFTAPWATFVTLAIAYLATLPLSMWRQALIAARQ
jgi:CDP-diacylglycerol---serine O-phosphatidyltransferase